MNGEKKINHYNKDVRCTTIYFPVGYQVCGGGQCHTTIERMVGSTSCSGSSGSNFVYNQGSGSDGGSPSSTDAGGCSTCPIPAPTRDLPEYDPPTIPSPKTIIDNLTNECARNIFKELSKGSRNLTDLTGLGGLDIFPGMLDLFKQSGKFDYQIQNGPTGGANAVTNRINRINVITLSNDYLQSATSLSIARTIIHETVHAYLLEHTYDMNLRSNYSTFDLLIKYFEKYDRNWNDTHHAAMSNFLLGMAVSLYNWDRHHGVTGGSLPFDYYYKLAFGGLINPTNPLDLIDEAIPLIPSGSSWSDINEILNNEASGNNQANGEKCN